MTVVSPGRPEVRGRAVEPGRRMTVVSDPCRVYGWLETVDPELRVELLDATGTSATDATTESSAILRVNRLIIIAFSLSFVRERAISKHNFEFYYIISYYIP